MGAVAYPNTGGRYAGFNFVGLGNGWYQIKHFFYPQYCLNAAPPVANIVPCNSNASSQRFKTTGDVYTSTNYVLNSRYFVQINSGNSINSADGNLINSAAGHSWTGIVNLVQKQRADLKNGVVIKWYTPAWEIAEIHTVTSYPNKFGLGQPAQDYVGDIASFTANLKNQYNSNDATMTREISQLAFQNSVNTYRFQTGCTSYPPSVVPNILNGGECICTTAAYRFWTSVVGTNQLTTLSQTLIPLTLKTAIMTAQGGTQITGTGITLP